MRKRVFVLLFVLMAFTAVCAAENTEINSINPSQTIFVLPSSVEIIGDEAFEGTAINHVLLPEGVNYIGERAFADIPSLQSIHVPLSATVIAETAFARSDRVTISAGPDSLARKWAEANNVPFTVIPTLCASISRNEFANLNQKPERLKWIVLSGTFSVSALFKERRKTQGNKITPNIELFGNQVQGRAPPMNRVNMLTL